MLEATGKVLPYSLESHRKLLSLSLLMDENMKYTVLTATGKPPTIMKETRLRMKPTLKSVE